ncbi:hypothetical protein VB638_14995 [Dolichospermum sp. UHCC 0684]|jgi:hypothetical protein|uniref:hypothetical protein n=1 Tax=unclassified Dolichospermum TaxID=2622029 RepID=UPI00144774F0|nr:MULTISPECIES: hypothetical protein [unclassified Dolichospermum]MBO1053772.1 hypothetical protein [Dolichospermum sp. DET73]MEA5530862.1 hypothetical protein [Dolichospermum sp. UHCC 0684]MTJ16685.1 hypothetical protein [Dolichospermum sp. UHCC 0299]MTJ34034.1 hypothetical protein [Dolichospermum sp. UHCC 0260]MTJ39201.1 hypothetical protein [Dolichospermum sp. UHCC 0406]
MKLKVATAIIITLSTVFFNSQKASAVDMKPLLENFANQLVQGMFSSSKTPTNPPSPSQHPENNYPSNPNYSNPYPSSPMPNNYPPYPPTQSYSPTQYSPSSSPAAPFIYNPIIIVPQSPPIFNNYSNNMPR